MVKELPRSRDDILYDQKRDVVIVVFELDVVCIFESRVPEFALVFTSTNAPVHILVGKTPCPIDKTLASNRYVENIKPKIQ
jgi:hypothetical protein